MSDIATLVSEGFDLIANELDAQRDALQNANKPVLEGLATLIRKVDALSEDVRALQTDQAELRRTAGLRVVT